MHYGSRTALAAGTVFLTQTLATVIAPTSLISEANAQALEEIVVTARKREESLQDIPLSVTALSEVELSKGAYLDLEDISMVTPGMQFNSELAGTRPGRLFGNVRIRGVEGSEFSTLQTASLFVDGIFALQGVQSLALDDLERVEIIKGPQSASFGRNSFAGAINYVTTTPSLDGFKGKVSADAGQYQQSVIAASVEGPITDKIALRVGVRSYNKGEMYTASDGGALGEQSSDSIYATLYAEPSDNFNLKARVFYQEDDDGSEAVGFFIGRLNDTCTGTTRPGLDEAGNPITLMPQFFVCGKIPEIGTPGAPRVDSNTTLFPAIFAQQGNPNYLIDNLVNVNHCTPDGSKCIEGQPTTDKFGIERRMTRLSLVGEYSFANGMTFTGTLAYNENKAANLRDWDMTTVETWWVINPQIGEDKSIDLRLESAQEGRVRWLAGFNAYDQEFLTSNDGGILAHSCGIGSFFPGFPCTTPQTFQVGLDGGDFVEVSSVYGSLSFDITDRLTVDIEGRYQSDKRSDGITDFSETFDNFLPRLSLSFKPRENINLYANGSRGVLPGVINSNILQCSDTPYTAPFMDPRTGQPSTSSPCMQYMEALGGNFSILTPDQTLDAFEIGAKTTWMDGRMLLNVAVYTQEWVDSPFSTFITVYLDDDGDRVPNANANFRPVSTPGSSEYSGVEVEAAFLVNENWTLNGNLSYNDNEFTEFETRLGSAEDTLGTRNLKGHRSSRFPEWSGSVSTTYSNQLNADWDFFARGDVMFMGEAFAGTSNLAILDSYYLVNARVGIEKDDLRLEIYAKNLFDEDAWRGGSEFTDFTLMPDPFFCFCRLGITLLPQDKRTVGIRAAVEF